MSESRMFGQSKDYCERISPRDCRAARALGVLTAFSTRAGTLCDA